MKRSTSPVEAAPWPDARPSQSAQLPEQVFTPSSQQTAVLKSLLNTASRRAVAVMTGHAGSGKTSLVCRLLIPELQRQGHVIGVSAFTHRACAVVRRKLAAADKHDVEVLTSSALLGFREVFDGSDTPKFKQHGSPQVDKFSVLIIDEASMLPLTHVTALQKDAAAVGCALIYVGDPAQLPPVGHEGSISPAFELEVVRFHLDEVHRAAGPIQQLTAATRNITPGILPPLRSERTDRSAVIVHPNQESLRQAVRAHQLEQMVAGMRNEFRVLAGTNAKVQKWNSWCRETALGAEAPPFVQGELLISRNPIFDWRSAGDKDPPIAGASSELRILSTPDEVPFPIRSSRLLNDLELSCWRMDVNCNQNDGAFELLAVAPGDWADLERLQGSCADMARKLKREGDTEGAKGYWRAYFLLRDALGHMIGPRYATTVHKAQGGEWDQVFVDVPDFQSWQRRNATEHRAMLYTAFTRARRELHVIGG